MKDAIFLNSYLDPIAKVWSSVQPTVPGKRVKAEVKKLGTKKVKK